MEPRPGRIDRMKRRRRRRRESKRRGRRRRTISVSPAATDTALVFTTLPLTVGAS